eukprot:6205437-Pleurochrysis_carterae.AAC.6
MEGLSSIWGVADGRSRREGKGDRAETRRSPELQGGCSGEGEPEAEGEGEGEGVSTEENGKARQRGAAGLKGNEELHRRGNASRLKECQRISPLCMIGTQSGF